MKKKKTIEFSKLKKGSEIKTDQLGALCSGLLLESPIIGKGLRSTVLIYSRASDLGLHDETGSVYSHQVKQAKIGKDWREVINAPA